MVVTRLWGLHLSKSLGVAQARLEFMKFGIRGMGITTPQAPNCVRNIPPRAEQRPQDAGPSPTRPPGRRSGDGSAQAKGRPDLAP